MSTYTGTSGNDTFTGGADADTIRGLAGNDTLNGGDGNDVIDGGTGTDKMAGGKGDDTFTVDASTDTVSERDGQGYDRVYSSATFSLAKQFIEELRLTGAANIDGTGNSLDNMLVGNTGNNHLNGGTGADTLSGGDGNDVLDGGAGIDKMTGGQGDDTFIVDSTTDTVSERDGQGHDSVLASVTYSLAGQFVEELHLTGTAAIDGSGNSIDNILVGNTGNNHLTGLGGADTLSGGDGNDVLDGGAGTDAMAGGAGDDTFVVDSTTDTVSERDGQGHDSVLASVSYSIAGQYVEELHLTGTAAINGTGNTLDNLIVGNAAANTLTGGDGNDTLDGGKGADAMIGGKGDDSFTVDNVGDTVNERDGGGHDSVYASVSFSLAKQFVEDLHLTGTAAINGTGNSLDNALFGNGAANVLDGGTGADHLAGGLGNDTYVVDNAGDVVTEASGAGTDLVQSSIGYALTANVENLTLSGSAAINGTGNGLANTLTGNTDNNVLDGGAGADTMIGGTGNDTYIVDNAHDVIREAADGGSDTVQSSVSYALATGVAVEQLTLTGGGNTNATGNAFDNILIGNNGNNVLAGGQGSDSLVGAGGADVFLFGKTDFTGASAGTVDRITDFVHAQGDSIDLSAIDAVAGGGDNAFHYIGSGAFSGQAGELRFDQTNADFGFLTGDTNGDGVADLTIRIDGAPNLSASDFNL